MQIFDRYLVAIKAKYPQPSPAMAAYIKGLETIEQESGDVLDRLAASNARWAALTEDEQIACQVLAATV